MLLIEAGADISDATLTAILSDPLNTARLLDEVAKSTGNAKFRKAAGMLRGRNVGGRPPRDDAAALDRIAFLLNDGSAATPEQAARFVARTLTGQHSAAASAERLAKKFRRQNY